MKKAAHSDFEVDLARKVQQLLFPKSSPVCSWCCMGVKNRMAQGLGGDFFEFITMQDGCQAIFVGDVTGHGLHASVVMSLLYGFIHHTSMEGCAPLELMHEVNGFLRTFAKRSQEFDHFFSTTLFYSIIDPDSLVMHYVNAGHAPPMVRRQDRISYLGSTAQPLGFFEKPEIEMRSFPFKEGDRFLLFTDGITDGTNAAGEPFGQKRLEEILISAQGDHMEFLDEVFGALDRFGACDALDDDCTAIVLDLHSLS